MQVPLNMSVPVKLDGSGAGTAKIGPVNLRETWFPEVASVKASSNVNEAECQLYEGETADQQYFIDGTLSGSTGDSTDHVWGPLTCGQYVWAVWSGGDAGAQAILRVRGTKEIG